MNAVFAIWLLSALACIAGSGITAMRLRAELGRDIKFERHCNRDSAWWDRALFAPSDDVKVERARSAMLRWFIAFLVVGLGGVGPTLLLARLTVASDFSWTTAPVVLAISAAAALFAIGPLRVSKTSSSAILVHASIGVLIAFMAVLVVLWS